MLNVNFPDCEPDAVKGMCATVQGQRNPDLFRIEDRLDTRGKAYYWIGVERRRAQAAQGDRPLGRAAAGRISVTPLRLDYTDGRRAKHSLQRR